MSPPATTITPTPGLPRNASIGPEAAAKIKNRVVPKAIEVQNAVERTILGALSI